MNEIMYRFPEEFIPPGSLYDTTFIEEAKEFKEMLFMDDGLEGDNVEEIHLKEKNSRELLQAEYV